MDIEKGNLELLFLKIPYTKITKKPTLEKSGHDYRQVNKDLYMQYAQYVFSNYSEDERYHHYQKLLQDMKNNPQGNCSIFHFIMTIAKKLLVYDGNEMTCRFQEILRWREVSFLLGQDFFTCAFLAAHDLEKGYQSKNFSWLPIIRSNDNRLHNILKRGMAENHFHLAGSTKVFELNWICLMNLIEGRMHDFKKLPAALQVHSVDRIRSEGNRESFYAECQRAALYRVYLFSVLKQDYALKERIEKLVQKADREEPMERLTAEIQDMIVLAKYLYGAKIESAGSSETDRTIKWKQIKKGSVLDYAFEKDMADKNDRDCCLLTGERRFLYECYKASVTGAFSGYQKNLFYIYLSIRTHFRGELIQINRQVGFANFSNYQDRKEIFIEGQKEYEDELIRLALNETMRKQNIVSLEARICPKNSAAKLYQSITKSQNIAKSETKAEEKVIYVLHFPKKKDQAFSAGTPRNQNVRMASFRQARSIAALLEKETDINEKIRGIDACSSEIACRPEAFGQVFRYLLDLEFPCKKGGMKTKLHATYHAGEDFLDIADGLRAIDEAIEFCGLERGSRIGHALALGISPWDYYKYKGCKLTLPKQVLLDDLAWILAKADETGCIIENQLRAELKERFYHLYEEIYGEHVSTKNKVSVWDYYQSWKLRGDQPAFYRLEEEEFLKQLTRKQIQRFDRYGWNHKAGSHIRKTECARNLYFAYHYNQNVRLTGDEKTEWKMDQRYADLIYQLQEKMIQKLVQEGIGIETNPSSNYLIGTIQKYDEHPILRFNSRKLKDVPKNMSLHVSMNTDDQGVFDTLLENEYALMAMALKKAKDENHQPLYDIEDIYEWIDYVRKMGVEQVFV